MRNKIIIISISIFACCVFAQPIWDMQHSGANRLFGIDFPPGQFNHGYACGANSYALRTTNGGATWTPCTTQVAGEYRDLDFPVDYMTGYLVGDFGLVAKTTDAGSIWQLGNITTSEQCFCVQFPGQDQIGFVGAANGYFAFTYDGGMSYTLIRVQPPYDFYDIHFLNPEYGFAVGENGQIFICYGTPDLFPLTSPTSEPLYGVYVLEDGMTVWVVGSNATCYKSTDAGQIWTRVVLPVAGNVQLNAVVFPTLTDGYICGTSGKILWTTDGGENWDTLTVSGNQQLEDIVFPSGVVDGWVCGASEAIYSTHEIGITENNPAPKSLLTLVSTPNPFQNYTNIKFSHPANSNATLKIYDCSGVLVRTLAPNATGTFSWDGTNAIHQKVNPGVYMLEATSNKFSLRHKLVMLD